MTVKENAGGIFLCFNTERSMKELAKKKISVDVFGHAQKRDAILEQGQQLKDVARFALLTRTRRGEKKKTEGGSLRRREKNLGQVRQVTAPAVS